MMKTMNSKTSIRVIRQAESGIALLTVLALLSIFAVVLVGFTYSLRMEENTIQQYADSVSVQESTEAAIQGVLAQLARDLDPTKPKIVYGRFQPHYISLEDPWAIGYAGMIGNLSYDARSHELDVRPQSVFDRQGLRLIPTPIPRGVDEDPKGDVTGMRGVLRQSAGDGAAGLKGVDDDLDGVVDGSQPADDDEDYQNDEDDLDLRRDGAYFPAGTGYDADNDRLGVFDESAKININFAGNNFNNGSFTYNLGVSPAELDLPLFLYERVVRYLNGSGTISVFSEANAEQLASQIVNFRYGSVIDGGGTTRHPGLDNNDDNNNNNPKIVEIEDYNKIFTDLSRFDGQPFGVVGNSLDDDNDGLMNEEDEHYIGPSTENTSGTPLSAAFKQENPEYYRPGDKIDNDGDGYIDEQDEGVDDPSEFDIFKPQGDDRPYTTGDDLQLVGAMRGVDPPSHTFPTLFEILRDSTTIYSQSDEVSGPLSGANNEVSKINPNLTSNWLASDIWNLGRPTANRADFQYSPKVHIDDLFALEVDNDGDWQAEDEVNIKDGKDNDGDGLIDEPSDDWDGNHYPSGDFDGFGESDVGAPAFASGIDYDRDQRQTDKLNSGTADDFINNMRVLGWTDEVKSSNFDSMKLDPSKVDLDERDSDILPGLVVEGNGKDDDGDLLVDDTGDFNGDGLYSYDPEWHVGEDPWGDSNGDGYPGIGADPEAKDDTKEGRIINKPDVTDDTLITNPADDDYDGYADFYDPQVLAAMFAPEWDGVDNDNDGEVDEIGERYIACYDDDEDGRMDEDPPEFQLALNLVDYIDSYMPFPVAEDPDVRQLLGKTQDDSVLADPVTFQTINVYSTRQRAFRMHPRLLAGPNFTARDADVFAEQMRLLLPNPPQVGMPVKFQGVEAIRINEVMPKPVIRLEAEDVLQTIDYDPTGETASPSITYKTNRFEVVSGAEDDGLVPQTTYYDSNWGVIGQSADGQQSATPLAGYSFYPMGFQNTYNLFLPAVNMDGLAPAFIFGVTNVAVPPQTLNTKIAAQPVEEARWIFENIPSGIYDVVLYLHPQHKYRPEVHYFFNNTEITMRSDYSFQDITDNINLGTGVFADPYAKEIVNRDTAMIVEPTQKIRFPLHYRLTPYPLADKYKPSTSQRVVVRTDGKLELRIVCEAPTGDYPSYYETSFDRVELINPWVQYVELENLSTEDLNLGGYQVDTPYGHYIIPEGTIIGRMKPSYKDDDGRELPQNKGIPGDGVPFEPLMTSDRMNSVGSPITSTDLLLEDNKLLLANHAELLKSFIRDNYPSVPDVDQRVVELELAPREKARLVRSLASTRTPLGSGELPYAQQSDLRFRLVDMQDDILSNNPADKYVTLYDPSGHYLDSFKYRTSFNNEIVDIPGNADSFDIVALPGYKGFESYERADTTNFQTEIVVDKGSGHLSGERSVPSSIQLDVKDAILYNLNADSNFARTQIGGYVDPSQGTETDRQHPSMKMQRFVDTRGTQSNPVVQDAHWNGWDFIGDYYQYASDKASESKAIQQLETTHSIAREAVAPGGAANVLFYQELGGFENNTNVTTTQAVQYTAFVWRMGVRELIRAGYDPDVDDQLTVRVLGRRAVNEQGVISNVDLPVGEVLITPVVRVLNPGDNDVDESPKQLEANPDSIISQVVRGTRYSQPVFAKLRNGDTAFTVDLREKFTDLQNDLSGSSSAEPIIEITVIIRKSTKDQGYGNLVNLTALLRPDLATQANFVFPWQPDSTGIYRLNNVYAGSMEDDNYFFKGIELFGRGRKSNSDDDQDNQQRVYLAGTPGRDNSGYVPAYPRRRLDLDGRQRDEDDIIDNTAYVKNGPLATLGEISRLYTGNKFETVNTPIIPQRVEDIADAISGRVLSNADLGKRAVGNNPEYQTALAQRERLDQWENQYTPLYNMITTADEGIHPGLININTATRETLTALPFCPPLSPGRLDTLQKRSLFNRICADFIIEGRLTGGHDMHFGIYNLTDHDFLNKAGQARTLMDTLSDYKLRSVGREYQAFKSFQYIDNDRFSRLNIDIQNIRGDQAGNLDSLAYLSTEEILPDDGPYTDIGTLLEQITHMRRRDRFSDIVRQRYDRTLDKVADLPGDLRERLNTEVRRSDPMSTEDMESLMNRISNLITVRSRAFSVVTRGRIFDRDGNITAQRKLEAVYER